MEIRPVSRSGQRAGRRRHLQLKGGAGVKAFMKLTSHLAVAAICCMIFSGRAAGANMYRLDLQSLAYMSTAVIEGDVTAYKYVHWVDVLTVQVTHVYAGDVKKGDAVVVGLSAYVKVLKTDSRETTRYGVGDHLILFIEPVTQQRWKDDQIPYWPVASGLKMVADGGVTGVLQESNPGSYLNTVDEGKAAEYPEKVTAAVKWAAEFRQDFVKHKSEAPWLLAQLEARPPLKPEDWGIRDAIATTLCETLAATGDREALEKAKALRTDHYERQLLALPPKVTEQPGSEK